LYEDALERYRAGLQAWRERKRHQGETDDRSASG
jgi:hypothetical protein